MYVGKNFEPLGPDNDLNCSQVKHSKAIQSMYLIWEKNTIEAWKLVKINKTNT